MGTSFNWEGFKRFIIVASWGIIAGCKRKKLGSKRRDLFLTGDLRGIFYTQGEGLFTCGSVPKRIFIFPAKVLF